jgi:hypothetical protein
MWSGSDLWEHFADGYQMISAGEVLVGEVFVDEIFVGEVLLGKVLVDIP